MTAALVLLSGCAGFGGMDATPSNRSTMATTATTTVDPALTVSNQIARDRARAAEARRVERILATASNVSGMVPGYVEPRATVLNRTSSGVRVRVVMTYSYEYHCAERAGAVDNLETRTRYLVTNESTRLLGVEQGVRLLCQPD